MDRGAQKRRQSALKINLKSTDGLYMTTVNPCNDFLVDFLIASKLKSEKQGIGKFTTYNLAIQSVRKYPLPLICEAQLAALEGFGDFFINQAAKRIQKHYKRGRLPTPQQIEQDDKEHFDALQGNRRKGYTRKRDSQQQGQYSDSFRGQQEKKYASQEPSQITSSKKGHSSSAKQVAKKQKNIQNYKPRPQSEAQKILKAMYVLKQREKDKQKDKTYSKGQINQIFFNWSKDSVKSWQFCKNRLKECGYIDSDKQQKDLFKLTEKGYNFIAKRMGRTTQKNEIKNNQGEKTEKKQVQQNEGGFKLKKCQDSEQLTIIINERKLNISENLNEEKISQEQRQQVLEIFQQLCQQSQHKVDFEEMQAGTFYWQIEGQILDYVVIRIVKNLSYFSKDKFMINCYCTKLADFTHITIIIENQIQEDEQLGLELEKSVSQIQIQNEKELQETILSSRAAGYKIVYSQSYRDTLQYISQTTKLIKHKLDHIKQIGGLTVLGCLQNINKRVNKKKMLATFYSRCIRFLISSKDAALQMTLKFGTFKNTYLKILKKADDETMQAKKRVLKTLFKNLEEEVTDQNIKKIIRFFFSESYD